MALTPEQAEDAARVRAVVAYSGIDAEVIAKAAGLGSGRTLDRVLKEGRALSLPEARALAAACRVPVEFLTGGWTALQDPVSQRLSSIEDRLADLQREVALASVEAPPRTEPSDEQDEDSPPEQLP